MRKSANIEKTDRAERSSWSVRALGSQVGMSPIGSYVGGLTSKGQVGVLLGEHRGWILRMAALIKGRLSDTKTFQVFFQTSDRKPLRLPFRLKELRTSAFFPTKRQVRDTRYEKDAEDLYKGYI